MRPQRNPKFDVIPPLHGHSRAPADCGMRTPSARRDLEDRAVSAALSCSRRFVSSCTSCRSPESRASRPRRSARRDSSRW